MSTQVKGNIKSAVVSMRTRRRTVHAANERHIRHCTSFDVENQKFVTLAFRGSVRYENAVGKSIVQFQCNFQKMCSNELS